MYSVLFIILSERTYVLSGLYECTLHTGGIVLAVLEGFPLYVIMRGAEHSAIAGVNELQIVVDVLPECQILRSVLKKTV